MNTLHLFFSIFWPIFLFGTPIVALITFGRRVSLDGNAAFIGPRSFTELAEFPRDEQVRLLHQADKNAFPRWRLIFPALMHAATFASTLAISQTIPKVTTLPDSIWVNVSFMALVAISGGWASSRVEARCLRPFLKMQIERMNHNA